MFSSSRRIAGARAGALWLTVTTAVLLLGLLAVPALARASRSPAAFADLLVAGCALAAVAAAACLWLVTTEVVLDVLRAGPEVRRTAGPVRALLLAACGLTSVVVLTTAAQPAHADPVPGAPGPREEHHDRRLAGLPLPDRAAGGVHVVAPDHRPARVRVRPGDSLWAIAEAALGTAATPARIAAYWPLIHRANVEVIGSDPDLLHPDQRLTLPPA